MLHIKTLNIQKECVTTMNIRLRPMVYLVVCSNREERRERGKERGKGGWEEEKYDNTECYKICTTVGPNYEPLGNYGLHNSEMLFSLKLYGDHWS